MSQRLAARNGVRLDSPSDALEAISCGADGLVFEVSDLSSDFFDLRNGLAGEVFQKFVNYDFRAAFVIPDPASFGERVVELVRDHRAHSHVRFFVNQEEALRWLEAR